MDSPHFRGFLAINPKTCMIITKQRMEMVTCLVKTRSTLLIGTEEVYISIHMVHLDVNFGGTLSGKRGGELGKRPLRQKPLHLSAENPVLTLVSTAEEEPDISAPFPASIRLSLLKKTYIQSHRQYTHNRIKRDASRNFHPCYSSISDAKYFPQPNVERTAIHPTIPPRTHLPHFHGAVSTNRSTNSTHKP